MARLKEKTENIKSNIDFVINNKLSNDNHKFEISTQDIKSIYNIENYTEVIAKELGGYCTPKQHKSNIINMVYHEKNKFYTEHVKTGIYKTIVRQLKSKVTQDLNLVVGENQVKITEISDDNNQIIYGSKYILNEEFINKTIENFILFDLSFIKIDLKEGKFTINCVSPFNVIKFDTGYGFIFQENNNTKIEKRYIFEGVAYISIIEYDEKQRKYITTSNEKMVSGSIDVFEIDSNLGLSEYSLIENVLIYSEIETLAQKEIKLGETNLFVDKQYLAKRRKLRSNFVPVNSPENNNADSIQKPLFEFVQPNIRSSDYIAMKKSKKEDIALLLGVDPTTIGLNENVTATEISINNSKSVETINYIRNEISKLINDIMFKITNNSTNKISLGNYHVEDYSKIIKDNQIALSSNSMTIKTAVERQNKDWTVEQVEIEYLTLMFQKGIIYTNEEELKAINYGIISINNEGLNGSIL